VNRIVLTKSSKRRILRTIKGRLATLVSRLAYLRAATDTTHGKCVTKHLFPIKNRAIFSSSAYDAAGYSDYGDDAIQCYEHKIVIFFPGRSSVPNCLNRLYLTAKSSVPNCKAVYLRP